MCAGTRHLTPLRAVVLSRCCTARRGAGALERDSSVQSASENPASKRTEKASGSLRNGGGPGAQTHIAMTVPTQRRILAQLFLQQVNLEGFGVFWRCCLLRGHCCRPAHHHASPAEAV